jgi:hypothetical protein
VYPIGFTHESWLTAALLEGLDGPGIDRQFGSLCISRVPAQPHDWNKDPIHSVKECPGSVGRRMGA